MANSYTPEPKVNPPKQIPDFELPTMGGGKVTGEDLRQGTALLIFHRYAACPLCASKMAEYRVRIRELGDMVHVPIFHSPQEKLERFIPDWADHPFEIAYDPEKKVYEKFGVGESSMGLLHPGYFKAKIESQPFSKGRGPKHMDNTLKTMPACFLTRQGQVVRAHYGRHWADIWPVDEALRQLQELG